MIFASKQSLVQVFHSLARVASPQRRGTARVQDLDSYVSRFLEGHVVLALDVAVLPSQFHVDLHGLVERELGLDQVGVDGRVQFAGRLVRQIASEGRCQSLAVGLWVARSAGRSTTDFFLSGRNMPWWLLGISMVATTFSADTPNLVTDIVRTNGVAGNWVWWAFLLTGC